MRIAHHLHISDTEVMKIDSREGQVMEWVKTPYIRRSMLERCSRRMEGPGLRRVCMVRRAKSCNQSLHDTNVYDGCVGAVLWYELFCLAARALSSV